MWTSLALVAVLWGPACTGKLPTGLLNNGTMRTENENSNYFGNKNNIGMESNSKNVDKTDGVDLQKSNYISDDAVNFETEHFIFLNSTDTTVTTDNYSEHIITVPTLPNYEPIPKTIDQDTFIENDHTSNIQINNTTPKEQITTDNEDLNENPYNTSSEHDFSEAFLKNDENNYQYTKNRLTVRHILNDYFPVTNPIIEHNAVTKNPYNNLETKTHNLKSYDNEYIDATTDKEYDATESSFILKKNSYLAKHFNLTKTVKTISDYKDMMFDLISRFNASEAHGLNNDSFSHALSNINELIDEKNRTIDETTEFEKVNVHVVEDNNAKNNDSLQTMGFYILATENFSNNKKAIQEALNKLLHQNFTTSLKRINRKMDYIPDKSDEKEKDCEGCCGQLNNDCLLDIKMRKLRSQMFDILLTIEQIKKSLTDRDILEKQAEDMKDRLRRQGENKNESNFIDKMLPTEIKNWAINKINTNNSDDLTISFKQVFNLLFDDKDFKQISTVKQFNTSRFEPHNLTNSFDQPDFDKVDYFDTYYNLKLLKKTLKTFGNLQHKLFRHILKAVDSIENRISNDPKFNKEYHLDFLTDGTNYSMDRKRRNISDVHEKAIRYILTLVDALLEEVHSSVISTKNNPLPTTSVKPYTTSPPLTDTTAFTSMLTSTTITTTTMSTVKTTNGTVMKPKKTFYSLSPLLLEKNGYTKREPLIQHVKKAAENQIVSQGSKLLSENSLKKREELKNIFTNPLLEKRYTEKNLKSNNQTLSTNHSSTPHKMDLLDYPESFSTLNSKFNFYPSTTAFVDSILIRNSNKHSRFNSKHPKEFSTITFKIDTTTTVTTTPEPPRYNEYAAFSELSTSGTSSKRLFTTIIPQFMNTSTIANISPIPIIKIPEKSLFDNYDAFEEKQYTPINDSLSNSEQFLNNSTSTISVSTVVSGASQILHTRNNSVNTQQMITRPTKFYFYSNDYEAESKDPKNRDRSTVRSVITTIPAYITTRRIVKPKFLNISHLNNINLFNDYENLEIDHYDSYNKTHDTTESTIQDSHDLPPFPKLNSSTIDASIRSEFKLFNNYDDNIDNKHITEETELRKHFKLDNFLLNSRAKSAKEITKYDPALAVENAIVGPPIKIVVDDISNFPYISKVTDRNNDRPAPVMITNGYHFNSDGLLESATEESETHTVINKILHDKNAALLDALDYGDKETVKPSTTTETERMDLRRLELRGVSSSNKTKLIDDKKVFKDPADVALNTDSYFDEVDSDASGNDRESDPPYPYEREGAFGVAYM